MNFGRPRERAAVAGGGDLPAGGEPGIGRASWRRAVRPAVIGLPVAVAALVLAGALTSSAFLTSANVEAVLLTASITGIVAVAMTPMTLSGNFISLATYQSAMVGALLFVWGVTNGWPVSVAILFVLAALIVIGVIQGVVVAAGLNPVLTTLAAGSILYGFTAIATSGEIKAIGGGGISWGDAAPLGLQLPIYVFAAVTVLATILIRRTVLGRQIVLTGANRETAAISGISAARIAIWVFVLFSIGAAVAGILSAAQLGSANINTLNSLTIDAAAAVLVGGTAIQGGLGSPLRSATGAVIMTLTTNIMLLNGFSSGVRQAASGAVVVAVVIGLELLRRRSS